MDRTMCERFRAHRSLLLRMLPSTLVPPALPQWMSRGQGRGVGPDGVASLASLVGSAALIWEATLRIVATKRSPWVRRAI